MILRELCRRMNERKGFSLTELLVAVLILSMVSSVVAGGIPVAKDAYEKITVSANAQVMLSNAISILRNELCTASELRDSSKTTEETPISDKTLRYYSPLIRNDCVISCDSGDLTLKRYADSNNPAAEKLVSSKSVGDRLHVIYNTVQYDEDKGIVTFTGLRVVEKVNGSEKVYAKMQEGNSSVLKIHVIIY